MNIARMFGLKPAAAPVETVTRAQHDAVIAALNEEAIRLRAEASNARAGRNAAEQRLARMQRNARVAGALADELLAERDAARAILREIEKLETPGSAHIGRKMAGIARAGLPEFQVAAEEREAA